MRFKVGDLVVINDAIMTQLNGQEGLICEAIPHKRGKHSLDKYAVRFPGTDTQPSLFWDIQLSAVMSRTEAGQTAQHKTAP
jgi:hypothetical protein